MPSSNEQISIRNDEETEKMSIPNIISRLADAPYILAFGTASFYLFGYIYYQSFCNTLSIPFRDLDLPLTFILSSGFYIASIIIFSALLILLAHMFYITFKFSKSKLNIILTPIFFFAAPICYIIYYKIEWDIQWIVFITSGARRVTNTPTFRSGMK